MKRIEFKKLTIIGFCAIGGTLEYKFNKKGLNIIRGKNGIGKTTIFSALVWVLFGQLLKKTKGVRTWDDKQPKGYKGTNVALDFTINDITYTVVRCDKFKEKIEGLGGASRLLLYEDGIYNTSLRDKPDVQARIQELLGYSFTLFKNSVLFGQKLTRLIGESGPRKKELFEEAFEVSWVGDAKAKAKKHADEYKADLTTWQEKEMALENTIQDITENLEELESSEKAEKVSGYQKRADIKTQLKELALATNQPEEVTLAMIDKVRAKRDKVQELLKKSTLLRDNLRPLVSQQDMINRNITACEMELHKFEKEYNDIPSNCTKCGSALDKVKLKKTKKGLSLKIEEHAEHKVELLETLASGAIIIKKLEKQDENSHGLYDKRSKLQKDIDNLVNGKGTYDRYIEKELTKVAEITRLTKELEEIKKVASPYKSLIITQTEKLEKAQKNYRKITKRTLRCRERYEAFKWVLDDPLSNKGIKAYIFSTMIEHINQELEKYQPTLGFYVNFDINLDSARKDFETTIFQGENIREYDELSGGQQQLVDVAIAFALHDVMAVGKPTNILLMDEVFESLDDENIERVIELIRIKADELAVHLVTHRKDFKVTNARELEITSNGIYTL